LAIFVCADLRHALAFHHRQKTTNSDEPIVGVAGGLQWRRSRRRRARSSSPSANCSYSQIHPYRNLNVIGGYHGEEVEEEGQEVTCLIPLKLLAHDSDMTAFGVEGSNTICTGQSQATATIAFMTLMAAFSEYTVTPPEGPQKRKLGVVSTYLEFLVRFSKKMLLN
jgi:hypothetical protein